FTGTMSATASAMARRRPALRARSKRSSTAGQLWHAVEERFDRDRKSTRLNSSHSQISYAVFCLKKKKDRHHVRSRHRIAEGQRLSPPVGPTHAQAPCRKRLLHRQRCGREPQPRGGRLRSVPPPP